MSGKPSTREALEQRGQQSGAGGMYGDGENPFAKLPEATQQAIVEHGASALASIENLIIGGMRFTATGLVQVTEVTEEDLKLIGDVLYRFKGSFQWLMGDWLNVAGVYTWGEVEQVAGHFRLQTQTLKNWKWVSSSVPQSLRKDSLDFFHHLLVAALPEDKQRHWLERAEYGEPDPRNPDRRKRWSVGQLRKEMGVSLPALPAAPPLLDKINKRRFGKLWRLAERNQTAKIKRDDIRLARAWLDELEKMLPKK